MSRCTRNTLLAVLSAVALTAAAQTSFTAQPEIVSAAAGPNSQLTVSIKFSPSESGAEVSGFDLSVGYDSTLGILQSVSDNTGQPGADVEYIMLSPAPLSNVAYADVYIKVQMTTAFDLVSPTNLALLTFQTTAGYSTSDEFPVYLNKYPLEGPYGGIYAGAEENFATLPVSYLSLEPTSSVQCWTLY